MTSDPRTQVILRTIQEKAGDNGIAWWVDVGPALAEHGLDFSHVSAVRDRGLVERSREVGLLRLTPAGRAKIS